MEWSSADLGPSYYPAPRPPLPRAPPLTAVSACRRPRRPRTCSALLPLLALPAAAPGLAFSSLIWSLPRSALSLSLFVVLIALECELHGLGACVCFSFLGELGEEILQLTL